MSTPLQPLYRLTCGCNSYDWGKTGTSSLAAHLCSLTPGFVPDEAAPMTKFTPKDDQPYAEMWMGTYPTLPSYVLSTSEPLQGVIDRYPEELLGKGVIEKFGHKQLPFLPKILSAGKALQLQVHPNKEFAAKKHKEKPDQFSDPNHKPEIALALTEFEAFVGFKPLAAIAELLNVPELKHLRKTGDATTGAFKNEDLRAVVHGILSADESVIKSTYEAIMKLPESTFKAPHNDKIQKLAPRLAKQYAKSDPGVLVALLTMNYLVLQPGEALYIPADGIHAYLSGDIVECMARSDNVLNTGFCPAASRDSVDEFCSVLTFSPHSKEQCMLPAKKYWRSERGKTTVYAPPLSEFNVLQTELKAGEEEVLGKGGAGIIVITKGGGKFVIDSEETEFSEGHIFFLAQGKSLRISAGDKGLLMNTSYVEN